MAAKSERSGHTFNRFLQARLPLPLARLYARAANAVSARNRLLSAYYLHEATLKLATSIEVMRYLDRPWRNKSVDRMLGHLALPSVGVWSSLLPVLAKEDGERSGPGAALCMEFTSRPLIGAMQVLSLGRATASGKVSAMQIYEHLPTFRASLITAKEASEPAGAASRAEVLLDAFVEILDETSILDHFSFAFLESVDVTEEGTELRWFDLTGPTPVRAAAEIVEGDPGLVEGGTYAQLADGSRLALQPLLLFREDEILPEMLFLDGTDPKRNCFYLEYATGKVEDPNVDSTTTSPIDVDVRAFLSRIVGHRIDSEEFEELVADSAKHHPCVATEASDRSRRFGEFDLLGELGRGGMGIVYLARQSTVGRLVALKLFPPAMAEDRVAAARFEREIAALGRCDHPNVVKVLAAGKAERTMYYAMELVSGTTLAGLARSLPDAKSLAEAISTASEKEGKAFEELPDMPSVAVQEAPPRRAGGSAEANFREVAGMMAQAALGVHHLHENGILHRDLKPANLMVSAEDQRVVVMDLGLAAVEGTSVTQDQQAVLGTLRYMSPEQLLKSSLETDRRSDVYSLGATLYELVTSLPVHDGDTQPRIIQQVLHEEPKRASSVVDDVPPDLDAILLRALAKDPNERYSSASEMAHDLERFARGEAVSARVPSARETVIRLVKKYRTYIGTAAAAVIALVALGVASYVQISRERRDVLRLSDLESLDRVVDRADTLWPAFPAKIPAMEGWIADAERLVGRLDLHRARLAALEKRPRAEGFDSKGESTSGSGAGTEIEGRTVAGAGLGASPQTDRTDSGKPTAPDEEASAGAPVEDGDAEDAGDTGDTGDTEDTGDTGDTEDTEVDGAPTDPDEEDPEIGRRIERANALVEMLADSSDPDDSESRMLRERLFELKEEIDALRADAGWNRIEFAKDQDQWWYDTLQELVDRLESLRDRTMPEIRDRIEDARRLDAEMAKYAAIWADAILEIADAPAYDGLRIPVQVGLVPIGRDPDSGLFEFAHIGSGAIPERGPDGRLEFDEGTALVFVLIPGGSFVMGAVDRETAVKEALEEGAFNLDPQAQGDEQPCHGVALDPFFLSKYEMTQAQWLRLTGTNPSNYGPETTVGRQVGVTSLHPVEGVNWNDCRFLLDRQGLEFPTEAQWEYAARAGSRSVWHTGSRTRSLADHGNFADDRMRKSGILKGIDYATWLDDGYILHAPVGRYLPNAFGLHDVHGNVFEWCRDRRMPYLYPVRDGDGLRLALEGRPARVTRGGHWSRDVTWSRSANRDYQDPDTSHSGLGLRPARAIDFAPPDETKTPDRGELEGSADDPASMSESESDVGGRTPPTRRAADQLRRP